MADWRKAVSDPREIRLFEALDDSKFEWRTLKALERESGMSESEVRKTIDKYPDLVRQGRTRSGEPIWTLQERYWNRFGFTQILDFMSNMATSSVKA